MVLLLYFFGVASGVGGAVLTWLSWPVAPYGRELPLALYISALAWLVSGLVTCLICFAFARALDGIMLIRRALKISDGDSSIETTTFGAALSAPSGDDYWKPLNLPEAGRPPQPPIGHA